MELKACPFCGETSTFGTGLHKADCYFNYKANNTTDNEILFNAWQSRPIEDELQRKLDIAVEALHKISIASLRPVLTKIANEALKKLEA